MTKYIGVDGCRAGWITVTKRDAEFEFGVFGTMSRLLDGAPQAELVLVDIPIGLPWKQCPSRPCDTAPRKKLRAPRASSLFPAPSRAAARADSLAMAQHHNQAEVGRKLSQQARAAR
jgi:predicted RNase H-like nuclease